MGVVYEAEHRELGRRVALKVLHPALRGNATACARFVREGRVAAGLRHPHVVEVLDAGTCEDGPFLAMEFVSGGTLAVHLRETGPICVDKAVELVLPILSALLHAHEEGVVHRDVKPANVLLARDRFGDVFPKIGDFGLGKWLDDRERSLTKDGVVGSLPYMAPEQVREAKAVDGRADQYSLGVLLYEAVAGRLPFEAEGSFALMEAICAGRSLPLAAVAPGVPAAFIDAVCRAISVRPEDRYPSLRALGRDLVRFSAGRSWGVWAREFSDAAEDDRREDTLDGRVSVATGAGASLGQRALPKVAWRSVLVPIACFALGAAGVGGILRAKSVRTPDPPVCSDARSASPSPQLGPAGQTATSASAEGVSTYVATTELAPASPAAPGASPGPSRSGGMRETRETPFGARGLDRMPTPSASAHREFGENNAPILE
jgi:hypothetical protein